MTATPGMSYRVEIFANDLCDPSGVGQGQTFLGYGNVTLDPAGQGDFTATVSTPLIAGTILTATATPSLRLEGTSNFSRCLEVEPPLDLALTVSGPPGPVPGSSNVVLNIVVANNSAQAASGDYLVSPWVMPLAENILRSVIAAHTLHLGVIPTHRLFQIYFADFELVVSDARKLPMVACATHGLDGDIVANSEFENLLPDLLSRISL